jgi:hypothetical protein
MDRMALHNSQLTLLQRIVEASSNSSNDISDVSSLRSFIQLKRESHSSSKSKPILNSRPPTPISPDRNDLFILTPSHILIGDIQVCEIEHSGTLYPTVSSFRQVYQHELNIQTRWSKAVTAYEKTSSSSSEETTLPQCNGNAMGRFIKVQPGADGSIRPATVRTATWIGASSG